MVRARDKTRADSVKKDDGPQLSAGDLVRGQDPTTKEMTMAGVVDSIVHGVRSVFIKFHKRRSQLFSREDVKPYTTDNFLYNEEKKKELDEAKENMVRSNTRYYREGQDAGKEHEAAKRSKRVKAMRGVGSKVRFRGM